MDCEAPTALPLYLDMILERFLLALQTVCSVQASSPFRAMSFVGGSWQTAAVRTLGRKCAINIELWSEKEMKALVEFNSEAATDARLESWRIGMYRPSD